MDASLRIILREATKWLCEPTEAMSFVNLVENPGDEIFQISDSIRFSSSERWFRFHGTSAAQMMDRIETYYMGRLDAPKFTRP